MCEKWIRKGVKEDVVFCFVIEICRSVGAHPDSALLAPCAKSVKTYVDLSLHLLLIFTTVSHRFLSKVAVLIYIRLSKEINFITLNLKSAMHRKIGTFTKVDFSRFHLCQLFHHFGEIEILSSVIFNGKCNYRSRSLLRY